MPSTSTPLMFQAAPAGLKKSSASSPSYWPNESSKSCELTAVVP